MMKIVSVALLAAGLAGCTTMGSSGTTDVSAVPFDPQDVAFIKRPGTATVTGQAFLRRNDGMVVYGAGSEVDLVPKSAYTEARVLKTFGNGRQTYGTLLFGTPTAFKEDDPIRDYTMKTIADGEGKFTFNKVPPGDYYVLSNVVWMINYEQQGGNLMAPVTVTAGNQQVILNGQ